MVGLDGQLVGVDALATRERIEHAAPHLLGRLDGEGEAEDLAGAHARLDPLDDRALERARLARAGAGGDPQRARRVVEDPPLLDREHVRHSGTSFRWWRGQIFLNSHQVQSAVGENANCSATMAATNPRSAHASGPEDRASSSVLAGARPRARWRGYM